MIGPILGREWLVSPRRWKFYLQRVVFVGALFSLVGTVWLLLAGMQQVRNIGDLSRFGILSFQLVVPLEVVVVMFLAAVSAASSVAQEKDRRTLVLLLLTRLSSSQVVLGKLLASLLGVTNMVLSTLPLLLLFPLLGGVSVEQALAALGLVLVTALACAALGGLVAFWREKTFQALAMTLLAITAWCALGEALAAGAVPGVAADWAKVVSPLRAAWSVCQPMPDGAFPGVPGGATTLYAAFALGMSCLLTLVTVVRLRVWNPSREVRPRVPEADEDYSTSTADLTAAPDAAGSWKVRAPRGVWHNPVLWREMCTWAYGRKMLVIRFAYLLLFAAAVAGLFWSVETGAALQRSRLSEELVPVATRILAPFFVISLVMINALAVNSITNERDGQALDLLLVTQITPTQFLLGKLVGVLYVTKEMVLLPLLLCGYLWWQGGLTTENLLYVALGLLVMDVFVAMLGIHCGMIYSQSRNAIGTSLGTVFFLFLGVVMCMLIMISFRGSFASQLPPFLLIILGGGIGLFAALGIRNPSPALALASFGLPFLTFFAITSFILRNQELSVFSVIVAAYGFATAAMVIPALSEFDFDMGRSRAAEEE
jgi:ABC-type Na+ efflux pump permease subunit